MAYQTPMQVHLYPSTLEDLANNRQGCVTPAQKAFLRGIAWKQVRRMMLIMVAVAAIFIGLMLVFSLWPVINGENTWEHYQEYDLSFVLLLGGLFIGFIPASAVLTLLIFSPLLFPRLRTIDTPVTVPPVMGQYATDYTPTFYWEGMSCWWMSKVDFPFQPTITYRLNYVKLHRVLAVSSYEALNTAPR